MYVVAAALACLTILGSLAIGVYDVVADFRWSRSEAGRKQLATVPVASRNAKRAG